jgi:hypothetical protein
MMATPLSAAARHQLVRQMVTLVANEVGPEFDFVLVVRCGNQPSYVMTDVAAERARLMLIDALHHPDAPPT